MNSDKEKIWDVIVIGGGPAGMMAAARAKERGRSVVLLEKNSRLGKKLSITGGGRCNVTNNKTDVRSMLSHYKDSAKFLFSTFSQHGVTETIHWFAERGVVLHEENEGRLFPVTNSAETICAVLAAELEKQQVSIKLNSEVVKISHDERRSEFAVNLVNNEILLGKNCVVASGGFSRPETGSTGQGFGWLDELGHTVVKNSALLVPVRLKESWVSRVSGVTLSDIKIVLYANGAKQKMQRGKILFTHFGVSGPTVLNMSGQIGKLLINGEVVLALDLFPDLDEGSLRKVFNEKMSLNSNQNLRNILSKAIPRALVKIILEQLQIDGETPSHSIRSEERGELVKYLKHFPLRVKSLLGNDKAIVTRGGVALTEIDFKTMSSKIVPGLFVIGDMLDIDRPSGGYSLQLCWSTGWVAGDHV